MRLATYTMFLYSLSPSTVGVPRLCPSVHAAFRKSTASSLSSGGYTGKNGPPLTKNIVSPGNLRQSPSPHQ